MGTQNTTKTIDFTKPLELDDEYSDDSFEGMEILKVIPVAYSNSCINHAVHYRVGVVENIISVRDDGVANAFLAFRNAKPQIAREYLYNVYPWRVTGPYESKDHAEYMKSGNRVGMLHLVTYSDDSHKQEYIQD